MFEEVENRIIRMDDDITDIANRLSSCENQFYDINNTVYSVGSIWNKIWEIECRVNEFQEAINKVIDNLEVLNAQLHEEISSIRADLDVKTEIPKQKIDLEISEQNSEFEIDPYITPQYYLDDKKNNDYWYWNGE